MSRAQWYAGQYKPGKKPRGIRYRLRHKQATGAATESRNWPDERRVQRPITLPKLKFMDDDRDQQP